MVVGRRERLIALDQVGLVLRDDDALVLAVDDRLHQPTRDLGLFLEL